MLFFALPVHACYKPHHCILTPVLPYTTTALSVTFPPALLFFLCITSAILILRPFHPSFFFRLTLFMCYHIVSVSTPSPCRLPFGSLLYFITHILLSWRAHLHQAFGLLYGHPDCEHTSERCPTCRRDERLGPPRLHREVFPESLASIAMSADCGGGKPQRPIRSRKDRRFTRGGHAIGSAGNLNILSTTRNSLTCKDRFACRPLVQEGLVVLDSLSMVTIDSCCIIAEPSSFRFGSSLECREARIA